MDKKNLTLFIGIMVIMVGIVAFDALNQDLDLEEDGRPIVRGEFNENQYNISFQQDQILVELSQEIVNEYNGRFLSVYAYDEQGAHVFSIKRVVNGKIIIDKQESPGFRATFDENDVVSAVNKGNREASLYEIMKKAKDEGRNIGLEKCLLGQQCIKVCPVAAIETLRKDPNSTKGRIMPDIQYDKCIEGGLCYSRCPTDIIAKEGSPLIENVTENG